MKADNIVMDLIRIAENRKCFNLEIDNAKVVFISETYGIPKERVITECMKHILDVEPLISGEVCTCYFSGHDATIIGNGNARFIGRINRVVNDVFDNIVESTRDDD